MEQENISHFLCPLPSDTQYIDSNDAGSERITVLNHQKCILVYLFSIADTNKSFTFHSYSPPTERIPFSFRPWDASILERW